MERLCPICGFANSVIARFCQQCNTHFQSYGPGEAAGEARGLTFWMDKPGVEAPPENERKTVTALFVDIKSSVELMANIDAEEAQSIVDPALQVMVDAVLFYDGYVVQILGDGVFALFGAPVAYEDHARRATYAAIEMQKALRAYALWLERRGARSLEARIGVESGEVVLRTLHTGGRLEYNPIGHTINLAARLQSAARPGSILIGDSTRRLVEGYFDLTPLPPLTIKGVSEPVVAFEVAGLGALRRYLQVSMTRGFTRFVGRDREMQALQRALELAHAGEGQTVAVVSEAGAGKSRLLFEFSRSLPAELKILEAYGLSHAKSVPWAPVVDMLTTYFDIRNNDDAASRREKVRLSLTSLNPDLLGALAYLHDLLGIAEAGDPLSQVHPLIKRERTLDAVRRTILAESQVRPVIFYFEDLHWVDAQSLSLINLIVHDIAHAQLLLVATYRPEFASPWLEVKNYSEIALKPLDFAQSNQLLMSLVADLALTPSLKGNIIERADGNPFFIEEIVRSLHEDGSLLLDRGRLPMPVVDLKVPRTVQGTLAERIDRAPADQKTLLQTLAVIGTRAPLDLVVAVSGTDETTLEKTMVELQRSDFIYAQSAKDRTIYVFKHVLTQEVTYQSLLSDRRKRLHERVGRAIEAIYPEHLSDHVGELAHHYSRSNNVAKAVEYLGRLGEVEIRRSAHAEAAESLRAAIGLVETLPDEPGRRAHEARLRLALGVALQASAGYAAPETAEAFEKATALSEGTGDDALFASALAGYATFSIVRADYATTFRLAERLSMVQDPIGQYSLEWLLFFALAAAYTGKQTSAEDYFLKALAVAPSSEIDETLRLHGPARANALSYYAPTKWCLGSPDAALKLSDEAIALAEELAMPIVIVQAQAMRGLLLHTAREYRLAEEWIDKAIAGATSGGFPYWQTLGLMMKASILVDAGQRELGLAQFDGVYAFYRMSGARVGTPWLVALRGEMLAKCGQFDPALAAFNEALALVEETGERYHEPEIHRLMGETLLSQGSADAALRASACLERALAISRAQNARMLELRAATSMARLLLEEGRGKDAFDLVGTVYSAFEEGFESRDLKDASDLLVRLSGAL